MVAAILDLLTLRCPNPQCKEAIDIAPDGCGAVMCLHCGCYYCNFCFKGFGYPNSAAGKINMYVYIYVHCNCRSRHLPRTCLRISTDLDLYVCMNVCMKDAQNSAFEFKCFPIMLRRCERSRTYMCRVSSPKSRGCRARRVPAPRDGERRTARPHRQATCSVLLACNEVSVVCMYVCMYVCTMDVLYVCMYVLWMYSMYVCTIEFLDALYLYVCMYGEHFIVIISGC